MSMSRFPVVESFGLFAMVGSGHIPAFFYDGAVPVFFDPGISAFGPLYYKNISERLGPRPDGLILLLTHSHFDHCGAAPYLLRKIPGIRVGASYKAGRVFSNPDALALMRRFNAEYEEQMARELNGEDTSFPGLHLDILLHEADRIELGGNSWCRVMETPGHTKDCVSYFFPREGVLVAGEASGVPDDDDIYSIFLSDYKAYISSIRKLQAVDARALCIAHAGILTGRHIQAYLAASLQAAQDYRAKIEDYLVRLDGDIDRIVDVITAREYDSKPRHMLNRKPFRTNLRAKIEAVVKCLQT